MGGYLLSLSSTITAHWTFFIAIIPIVLLNLIMIGQTTSAEQTSVLFQDLGIDSLPDVTKINISQEEYNNAMNAYLTIKQQHSTDIDSVPEFITFYMVNGDRMDESNPRLRFPIEATLGKIQVDNAVLRILSPSVSAESGTDIKTTSSRTSSMVAVRVQVFQVIAESVHLFDHLRRRNHRRLVVERYVYLSTKNLTKWCEFDVTDLVQSWFDGESNMGLELSYSIANSNGEYGGRLIPLEAAISALVYTERYNKSIRNRRSVPNVSESSRTDCRKRVKRKCCRHKWEVTFSELGIPEMNSILHPKKYHAGFCQGQCVSNSDHATNHSRIQSLVRQLELNRKIGLGNRPNNQRPVPKTCCAPSKLKSLEVVRVNPNNASQLMIEVWDNMEVEECACS